MEGLLRFDGDVVVFGPERAEEALRHPGPRIAFLPVITKHDGWWVADAAEGAVGVRADAYACDDATLAAALAFVRQESREGRHTGPLRFVYLGSLGELPPPAAPPIGGAVNVGTRIRFGRNVDCEVSLRTGPHSDMNTVARVHALAEATASGARITDTKSTNGTWVGGRRIDVVEIAPGDEIAITSTHRFRLDGRP